MRPWAAARPLAVRAASFARRVVSKPGQALPPPTGTAAWISSPYAALQTAGDRRVVSKPGQALPPPTGAAAWISSRAAPSTQQGIGVSGFFLIQLDPAASFVQFPCAGID